MSENKTKQQELGSAPIGKLLIRYAFPAIIAMTASSLYNMVDSMFIGLGPGEMAGINALTGLAVTFPFMNLGAAFGALVGVGASAITSIKMGQRDKAGAEAVLGNVVILDLVLGVLFTIVCFTFLDPMLYFFGANQESIPYARSYMEIILLGNVITHLYMGLNDVTRSSGYPMKAMFATLFAVVINAAFNAIFIFVLEMGIRGAAYGTICSQLCALIFILVHLSKKTSYIHFHKGIFNIKWKIVGSMVAIGVAPFLMNLCATIVVKFFNSGLGEYGGNLSIGAYGIVNRLVFFFIMIVMGFNQGMQPIAGYNYGAQNYRRVSKVFKYTASCAFCVTTIGFLMCSLFPRTLISMFTNDAGMIEKASYALKIMVFFFPLVGLQMVSVGFLQSIGMASKAIFLSLTRQLLFLLPCLIILPLYYGEDGIWYSIPVADILSVIVAAFVMTTQYKILKAS